MAQLDKSVPKLVEFPFGTLILYARHVEARYQDGVNFDQVEAELVINAINDHFGGQLCGYISIRESSYSVNPIAAQVLFNKTVIKRAAFVIKSSMGLSAFTAEKIFYQIPAQAFSTLEEAEVFLAEGLEEALSS